MEDLLDEIEEEDANIAPLCAEAINVMTFFETFVEKEYAREKSNKRGSTDCSSINNATSAIARIVSHRFYDDDLSTDPKRAAELLAGPAPLYSVDERRLPKLPVVVVVNMPDLEAVVGQREGDQSPPPRNTSEVKAVIDALSLLRARPDPQNDLPTLSTRSPYAKQVALLDREIEAARSGRLKHLEGFSPATRSGSFCSTVESLISEVAKRIS